MASGIYHRLASIILCCLLLPSIAFADLKAKLSQPKGILSETREFYQENNHELFWFKDNKLSSLGTHAVKILKNAAAEGLNPEDYKQAFTLDQIDDKDIADIILTNEMIRFITHVRVGRVPSHSSGRLIKVKSSKTTPVQLLLQSKNNPKQLDQLAPPQANYQSLKKILTKFRNLAKERENLPQLKDVALKKGIMHDEVAHLREILAFYGDLKDDTSSKEFDEDLEKALKKFQERHFLDADGIVGQATRKALNTSLQEKINTIMINLERWRWLPDDLGEKYIIVNVGGFEVLAIQNDKIDLRIKAIVGAPITKTPIFYANLQNIIINPAWNVPPGVMARQKLHKIINDPSYVYRSGMTVLDSSGNAVDPYQVDWANEGMSYRLRQHPGAHNALGRIKLNIQNPYTVYLHGTPDEELFERTIRGFSSGCIRLQKPNELAHWVLSDENKWSLEQIKAAINSGRTQTIPIGKKIPVYFTYQTVWMDESGTIYFSQDHYHLDPPLMSALKLSDRSSSKDEEEESSDDS